MNNFRYSSSLSLSFWVDRRLPARVRYKGATGPRLALQIPVDKKSAPTPDAITPADSSDSPTITQPIFFNPSGGTDPWVRE